MKLSKKLRIQSISDIITNSSSEIFVQIKAIDAETIKEIEKILNKVFEFINIGVTANIDEEYTNGEYTIDFWREYSSGDDYIPEMFEALIQEVLTNKLGTGTWWTEKDVPC